jgi:hypothetical protein
VATSAINPLTNSTSKSSASSIIPPMASTFMGFLVVPSLMMSLVL